MILEAANLTIRPNDRDAFETAFSQASSVIPSMSGYISHELHRCIEVPNSYLLLVRWETLEDHTVGFRSSDDYQQWRSLLHHFYDPFPSVQHFEPVPLEYWDVSKKDPV